GDSQAPRILGEAAEGEGRGMILFAYGANMNPGRMAELCPEFRTIGVARLLNYRLCFPRFSQAGGGAVAGMEPHAENAVWGVLYEISPGDLPILNYHQGYDPDGLVTQNQHVLREITVLRMGGSE